MTATLHQIPPRALVMLDANVVVYALFPQISYHATCKQLLERGALGELHLCMVINATADVIHRAMILEVLGQGLCQKSAEAVSYLKKRPQVIKNLVRYKTILDDLVQGRINILPLTYVDLYASKQYRETYGLMTNDSIIAAVMERQHIQYLATNDPDFERVPGITVWRP